MFRWPLSLTPLSQGSAGTSRDGVLEITPRGAVFTLAALTHIGHPAHLAVIDGYLKGQMRVSAASGLGEDSHLVASALAAPLVAAHELGIGQLGLADSIPLPPAASLDLNELPVRSVDSPRFLLRVSKSPDRWVWVRGAERFEVAGCTGTPQPGLGSPWHDVIVQLPERPSANAWATPEAALPPIEAELRAATSDTSVPDDLAAALRQQALARFARAGGLLQQAAADAIRLLGSQGVAPPGAPSPQTPLPGAGAGEAPPLAIVDLQLERQAVRAAPMLPAVTTPASLANALRDGISRRQPAETVLQWRGIPLTVSLTPDLDGHQTLCLLPPAAAGPDRPFELMREATWEVIEALMGRPLAERRTEPVALRLVGADGRTTTLEIGASVVVVRNQVVFTAWVGSDGRAMLKLFPAGGMIAR